MFLYTYIHTIYNTFIHICNFLFLYGQFSAGGLERSPPKIYYNWIEGEAGRGGGVTPQHKTALIGLDLIHYIPDQKKEDGVN